MQCGIKLNLTIYVHHVGAHMKRIRPMMVRTRSSGHRARGRLAAGRGLAETTGDNAATASQGKEKRHGHTSRASVDAARRDTGRYRGSGRRLRLEGSASGRRTRRDARGSSARGGTFAILAGLVSDNATDDGTGQSAGGGPLFGVRGVRRAAGCE